MAIPKVRNILLLSLALLATLGTASVMAQTQCGSKTCAPGQCCSKFDFCGTGNDYCGANCKAGPCTTNGVSVANIVTDQFFSGIKSKAAAPTCPNQNFYTRQTFLSALSSYPRFATTGSVDDSKREIAAFFAHVTHETGYFCFKEETGNQNERYCDPSYKQYPCNPNKRYNGRGPLQLTWNYNYGGAGKANNFDGLNSPETVTNDPLISFKVALWYWMENVSPVLSQGFGATIQKVNGDVECGGKRRDLVQARVDLYRSYCQQFGVAPGNNLFC
ncbi:endochitinase EP3-like [Humulus lupulus]|uniref:endochitinase EP3-like n=1 Tax=Humulus lupulus TaxID=3486 RepID=UPI002B40DDAF|nr:endochitinase EP3-like [Humulus lupulus]